MTKLFCRDHMVEEMLNTTNPDGIVRLTLSGKQISKMKCHKCSNPPEYQI